MKKQMSNSSLFLCFVALTGAVIAGLVWLYLKIANVGITVIWEMIPAYIDSRYYTILMCLAGGVAIGLFHRVYGPYPDIRSGWQILSNESRILEPIRIENCR